MDFVFVENPESPVSFDFGLDDSQSSGEPSLVFSDQAYSTDGCIGDVGCRCPYHFNREKWETTPYARRLPIEYLLAGEEDVVQSQDADDVMLDPHMFVSLLQNGENQLETGIRRVKNAINFIENCYINRRKQESVMPQYGEEPLFPWTIDFTRKIHHEFFCMALPHIVGPEIFQNYQAELMDMFGFKKINKAVAVIMARGFGKSESMVMAAAMAVLCSNYAGTEQTPYDILVISAKLDGAVALMENIDKCVHAMYTDYYQSVELLVDNRIHKVYKFTTWDNKVFYVKIKSISCTERSIRGQHPHLVIVDEFCFTDFDIVQKALFPIIRETKTRTIFASTPAEEGTPWASFVQRLDADVDGEKGLFVLTRNTMCCDECRQLDPASRLLCRHLFGSLQPWRDITSVYPALTEYDNVNVALAEYMGEPPVMIGACFDSYQIETCKRMEGVEGMPNDCYEIHVTADPTGNSADEKSGSNFAVLSWVFDIHGNVVILGVTDERISSSGMEPSRAAVDAHLDALRESYIYYSSCSTVYVDVEGNAPINSQDIVKTVMLNFSNHGDKHKLRFVKNPKKTAESDHQNIIPVTAQMLEKGVIAIQDLLRHHKIRKYKYIFGTTGGWATLMEQLTFMRREMKYASGKVTISGKGYGQRDDVAKSLIRGIAARGVTRTPRL